VIDRHQRPPREHVSADRSEDDDKRKAEDENDEHFAQLTADLFFESRLARRRRNDLARGRILVKLTLDLLVELVPHCDVRRGGVHRHHQKQHDRVPCGETDADRSAADHGSPSRNMKPTPRTV
jgi:hypothetical protein